MFRMNQFEVNLMISSKGVDSKVVRMAIYFRWEILDGFLRNEFWCTDVQSPRFFQVTFNFELD